MNTPTGSPLSWLGRLLCLMGFHDDRVVEATFGFGGGSVQKVECRRCGRVTTRQG